MTALATFHALGQTTDLPSPGTLLRPALDDNDEAARRNRRPAPPAPDRQNVGDRPAIGFGNPPAFGAGTTGFDSTNRARRLLRPTLGSTRRPANTLQAAPLPLTPSPLALPLSITPTTTTSTSTSASTTLSTTAQTSTTTTPPGTTPAPTITGSTPTAAAPSRTSSLVRVPASAAPDSDVTVVNAARLTQTQTTILRRRTAADDDPFAPVGIRYGAFLVLPAVEVTGGYDTNPARVPDGKPSSFVVVAPEVVAKSDWERHEATATLRGSYTTYQMTPELDRPTFDGKITGRIDVTRNTRLLLEGTFQVGTDNPGSPNIQAGLTRFPIYTTLGGTVGIDQSFNRLDVTAKGTVERTEYQDSHFTDGTTESNDDRDFNRYGGTLRVAYDLMPGLKPFVEGGADERVHDLPVDRTGFERDSIGWYAKAGSTFEFSRKLTGEIAVGYLDRLYKDPSLPDLNGVTVDGSLIYAMSALTNIKFNASTVAQETTVPGTSGVFTRNAGIEVEHAFRRWLVGSLKFNYGFDDYVGSPRQDDRYAISGSIIYKLNRMMQLKAEIREEWLRSTTPVGVDYTATVFLLGMRLQR